MGGTEGGTCCCERWRHGEGLSDRSRGCQGGRERETALTCELRGERRGEDLGGQQHGCHGYGMRAEDILAGVREHVRRRGVKCEGVFGGEGVTIETRSGRVCVHISHTFSTIHYSCVACVGHFRKIQWLVCSVLKGCGFEAQQHP